MYWELNSIVYTIIIFIFFFTGRDNCFAVSLSPTPSDSNRKWWENILTVNKAVSIDHHQGYKSKLNNKFWKVLQFRETDHLSGRSSPSVSHTPSTSSSYRLEAKFYKDLFPLLKFLWALRFSRVSIMLTLSISFESSWPAERLGLGSMTGYYFKATHISISCFLYTSAVKGSDLWDAKLVGALWSSANNRGSIHVAVRPHRYSIMTQKFSIIHRRFHPRFQIKC